MCKKVQRTAKIPKKKFLLYIDDDFHDIEFLKYFLDSSSLDLDVVGIEDGIEALKFLRNESPHEGAHHPEIIFLDLNMPRKDGREVLREIKSDRNLRDIPVVIFTSSDSRSDMTMSYENGANFFLTKPVGLDGYAKVVDILKSHFLVGKEN